MSERIGGIKHMSIDQLQEEFGQDRAAIIAAMVIGRTDPRMRPGVNNSQAVREMARDIDEIAQRARAEITVKTPPQTGPSQSLLERLAALEANRMRQKAEDNQTFTRRLKLAVAGGLAASFLLIAACNGIKQLPAQEEPEIPVMGPTRAPDGKATIFLEPFLKSKSSNRP